MNDLISYRQRQKSFWILVALFSAGALLLSVDFAQWVFRASKTQSGQASLTLWFGSRSIFETLSSVVTTLSLVIAGFLAFRSYETNRRAAIANRYQKGVELLAAAADSSKLGGIELLSIAAAEAHREYQVPVVRTLRQFLQERCSSKIRTILAGGEASAAELAAETDFVVMSSLSVIASTDVRKRWVSREADEHGVDLYGICLQQMHFSHVDFSKLQFHEAVFGNVLFESCTFREVAMDIRCTGEIAFNECTFSKVEIRAADIAGNQLDDAKLFIKMTGSERASASRVNGRSI